MRGLVVAMLVIVAGCGSRGRAAPLPDNTRGVRLADAAAATEYSKKTVPLALPFELDPEGLNVTALAIGFLRAAEASGARYVSDLAIAIHFTHDGVALECVSRFAVGARAKDAAATAAAAPAKPEDDVYSTTVQPWRPAEVRAVVDDRDLVCVEVAVATTVPRYTSRHDASVGKYYAPGELPTESDVWMEYKDDCHLQTRRREVDRYAHYVATRITPVDVARLERDYAQDPVTELPPECHEVPAGERPAHRVMGNVHYVGGSGRASELPDIIAH